MDIHTPTSRELELARKLRELALADLRRRIVEAGGEAEEGAVAKVAEVLGLAPSGLGRLMATSWGFGTAFRVCDCLGLITHSPLMDSTTNRLSIETR